MIPKLDGEIIAKAELAFMLRFWTESDWQVNLEGAVTLIPDDGPATVLHDDVMAAALPDDLRWLFGARITKVEVAVAGDLIVGFADRHLKCAADPDYESWQLYGPRGEIIVCGPGGRLTEWGPRRD
ncbi:DUF6188 family protein [Intrasporangium flavum]|uniref:DUF6188 family protein n=1 Tax=Intrasporangium flavum TaxID=1428657 RepID=UPI00096FCC40|nr:DUF6188 family protein [Intrasporangium flavum]